MLRSTTAASLGLAARGNALSPAAAALRRATPRGRQLSTTPRAYQDDATGVTPAANSKAYAKFSVYKGKAAMQMSLIGPTWRTTASGSVYIEREGVIFMEFASVAGGGAGGQGFGERLYDWSSKVVFALKPTEAGYLLDKDLTMKGFELFHDPDKGRENEGQMRKTFTVKQNPDASFFFTVNQTGANKSSITVPVTPAELAVIRNLAAYSVPRLVGLDIVCDGMHTMQGSPMG